MTSTEKQQNKAIDMTTGSIAGGMIKFIIPLFIGQVLQQLYSIVDAYVIGNFADNDSFAAISLGVYMVHFINGFFTGVAVGGGVVISYFTGAKEEESIHKAVHNCLIFGIFASVLATILGSVFLPTILKAMNTPDSVLPYALRYYGIYFAGVSTVILYNMCMSILQALGDSLHPLYYLMVSSLINVVLDLILVAGFHLGVTGAAVATVFSQGVSVFLCLLKMIRSRDYSQLRLSYLRPDFAMLKRIIQQGLPTGIQNSMISIGNMVIQSQINGFGPFAISGQGAYSRIEGMLFIPVTCISMTLPTFVSQNLGARQIKRAKKGALFGILAGMLFAEAIGVVYYLTAPTLLRMFVDSEEALFYSMVDVRTIVPFFFLVAFAHSASGVLRGCGKSIIPMVTMLSFWCIFRVIYITIAIRIWPEFKTIAGAYPLTWSLSCIVFLFVLFFTDWSNPKNLNKQ